MDAELRELLQQRGIKDSILQILEAEGVENMGHLLLMNDEEELKEIGVGQKVQRKLLLKVMEEHNGGGGRSCKEEETNKEEEGQDSGSPTNNSSSKVPPPCSDTAFDELIRGIETVTSNCDEFELRHVAPLRKVLRELDAVVHEMCGSNAERLRRFHQVRHDAAYLLAFNPTEDRDSRGKHLRECLKSCAAVVQQAKLQLEAPDFDRTDQDLVEDTLEASVNEAVQNGVSAISTAMQNWDTFTGCFATLEALANTSNTPLPLRAAAITELLVYSNKRATSRGESRQYGQMKAEITRYDSLNGLLPELVDRMKQECRDHDDYTHSAGGGGEPEGFYAESISWSLEVVEDAEAAADEALEDVRMTLRQAESRAHLAQGHEAMKRMESDDAANTMHHALNAVDCYKVAINSIGGFDLVIEAEAFSKIGTLYSSVFRNAATGLNYFKRTVRLAVACQPVDITGHPWYKRAFDAVSAAQREEAKKDAKTRDAERKPYLDELKPDIDKLKAAASRGSDALLQHVYKAYKPGGQTTCPAYESAGKAALKACVYFHPDKCANQPRKTQVLFEEITLHLTGIINSSKGF